MSGKAIRETLGFLSGGGGAGVATSVILVRNFFEDLRRLGASGGRCSRCHVLGPLPTRRVSSRLPKRGAEPRP